jgi:anti-sigma28 factor (negative regulator of flagellin synthesis)
MFLLDLPIETTRIISLTKARRSKGTLEAAPSGEECGITQLAPARMERVVRLRKAIAEGTYRISAAQIAEKMIAQMLAKRSMIH